MSSAVFSMELNLRFLQFFLFQSLKSYVEIVGRAVYLKTPEKQDELESKVIFSGILEDATFKMPFVSHKLNIPWQRDTVYKFERRISRSVIITCYN